MSRVVQILLSPQFIFSQSRNVFSVPSSSDDTQLIRMSIFLIRLLPEPRYNILRSVQLTPCGQKVQRISDCEKMLSPTPVCALIITRLIDVRPGHVSPEQKKREDQRRKKPVLRYNCSPYDNKCTKAQSVGRISPLFLPIVCRSVDDQRFVHRMTGPSAGNRLEALLVIFIEWGNQFCRCAIRFSGFLTLIPGT